MGNISANVSFELFWIKASLNNISVILRATNMRHTLSYVTRI